MWPSHHCLGCRHPGDRGNLTCVHLHPWQPTLLLRSDTEGETRQRPHLNSAASATLPFLILLPDRSQDTEPAGSCSGTYCSACPPFPFVFSSPPATARGRAGESIVHTLLFAQTCSSDSSPDIFEKLCSALSESVGADFKSSSPVDYNSWMRR